MVMWQGFVTLGRTELMLTFIAVSILMTVLGYAVGQIVMIAKRPAVVMPEPCARPHCDDEDAMRAWLDQRDLALITNEMLSTTQFAAYGKHSRQISGYDREPADVSIETWGKHSRAEPAPDYEFLQNLRGALQRWDVS